MPQDERGGALGLEVAETTEYKLKYAWDNKRSGRGNNPGCSLAVYLVIGRLRSKGTIRAVCARALRFQILMNKNNGIR
ncbi:hypothetical protein N9L68_02935 [bacterium]|nr:hypothetical protein [bacterium]